MKIVNRKKFIRSVFIVILMIFVLSFILVKSCFSYSKEEYKTLYVQSGDTLWSIASKLQKTTYYKGKDIRLIIDDIKEINNLNNSNISINQELKIPVS